MSDLLTRLSRDARTLASEALSLKRGLVHPFPKPGEQPPQTILEISFDDAGVGVSLVNCLQRHQDMV